MSILFPGSPKQALDFRSDSGIPGLVYETATTSCAKSFFGRVKDLTLEYAGLSRVGSWLTPGSSNNIASTSKETAVRYALSRMYEGDTNDRWFRDIISPVFTPGEIKTISRDTGGYDEYAGQGPSEFTFSTKFLDNLKANWARKHLSEIKAMSMGMYLRNEVGDIMGLMVGANTTVTLSNITASKFAFLPIPILSLRRIPSQLGDAENPDLMNWSILLPPNWDSPYTLGSTIECYPASLQNLDNSFGRIVYSALMIIPADIVRQITPI